MGRLLGRLNYEGRPVPEELRYTACDLPGIFAFARDGSVVSSADPLAYSLERMPEMNDESMKIPTNYQEDLDKELDLDDGEEAVDGLMSEDDDDEEFEDEDDYDEEFNTSPD